MRFVEFKESGSEQTYWVNPHHVVAVETLVAAPGSCRVRLMGGHSYIVVGDPADAIAALATGESTPTPIKTEKGKIA